jgi:hypothetical protein
MSKADLVADLRASHAQLEQALDGLTDEHMLQVGAVGIWSIKDVLAHLVAWEAELVTALSRLEQHKRQPPRIVEIDDIDEWNEEQYHINAARSLDVVLDDFQGVHKHLIAALEHLDDRTLDDNRRWPWMEGEPLSYLVYENAIWHEDEHTADIRAWREAEGF